MKRWKHRCDVCGNPRHFLPFYVRGWLAWQIVRVLPVRWSPLWLIGLVGDYAYDHRDCQHLHGPQTVEDDFEGRAA